MGTRTSMDCPCGFLAQVEYGCGMAIGYDAVFPHFCTKCGLVSASINKPNPSCPSCGSHEIAMYGERRVSPPLSGMLDATQQRTIDMWTHDPRVTKPQGGPVFDWDDCRITMGRHLCPSCRKFDMLTGRRFRICFD